jgi:hypothetical protein
VPNFPGHGGRALLAAGHGAGSGQASLPVEGAWPASDVASSTGLPTGRSRGPRYPGTGIGVESPDPRAR